MSTLIASLSGPSYRDMARILLDGGWHLGEAPRALWINDGVSSAEGDWKRRFASCTSTSSARWNDEGEPFHQVNLFPRSEKVSFSVPDGFSNEIEAMTFVEPLPFELCAFGSVFFDEWIDADYPRWSFSRSHIDHGWGCSFRGAGHQRLVSRRWLDFGPWRVIRRPNDTTFIQFHDLDITNSAEAYEQAKVGHERMGLSETGGFIQQIEPWMLADVRGLYIPSQRRLEIVVAPGTSVPQSRMLNACVLRLHHRLTPSVTDPVDTIAYVFIEEADARAHLHELWLRELECWVVDGAGKRRLDADYRPVPDPPAWVKRLP